MASSAEYAIDTAVLRSASAPRRRRILRLLRDRSTPVSIDELAASLAADERGEPPSDERGASDDDERGTSDDDERAGPDDERDEAAGGRRADLVHNQLPRLETAGLVDWDRDDGTVTTTDHSALSDPRLDRVIADPSGDWDSMLESVADDRRRCILSVLKAGGGVMDLCDLAKRVVARERDRFADYPAGRTNGANDAVLSLHHVHLPKLERVGLLSYHAVDRTVSYQGDATLADELLEARPAEKSAGNSDENSATESQSSGTS